MPSSVSDLLLSVGLGAQGPVRWGQSVPAVRPGVYLVSLSPDPNQALKGALDCPALNLDVIAEWIHSLESFRLDGKRPMPEEVARRLCALWLPDETVLYIGRTTASIKDRIDDYYSTPLGAKRPHAGGHWLKTLSDMGILYVYWAPTEGGDSPERAERCLLDTFVKNVSSSTRERLYDPERPFPWANLEHPRGNRKRHGLNGTRRPRPY